MATDEVGREIPYSPAPGPASAPAVKVPPGATDCHFHVFGPHARYPLSAARHYTPAEASAEAYLAMAAVVGLQRRVIVQASPYGMDNGCTLDAIPRLGRENTRGVAVIDAGIADAELDRMHEAGVRGIRFNTLSGGTSLEHLGALAKRIARHRWHIQIWATTAKLAELETQLLALPTDIVIDHLGLASPAKGTDDADFRALLRLLRSGKGWIKLCGYRASLAGPPYEDVLPLVQEIVTTAPERCVWGTDWPHPMLGGRAMPDDGQLMDVLAQWAGDAATLQRILVANPAKLYGFG